MDEGAADTETVAYVQYVELQKPDLEAISAANVERGFQSKEWRKNFETLSTYRVIQHNLGKPIDTTPMCSCRNCCPRTANTSSNKSTTWGATIQNRR